MSPTQLKENPGGSTFNIGLSNSFIHQKRSSSASTYIDSYVRKLVPTDSASALQKNISSPCLSRKNLSQVICAKELVQIKRSPAKKEQPSPFYIGIGIHLDRISSRPPNRPRRINTKCKSKCAIPIHRAACWMVRHRSMGAARRQPGVVEGSLNGARVVACRAGLARPGDDLAGLLLE